jgi:phosphoglycerol transferase MdoB-like AlkP superfamily enzyme
MKFWISVISKLKWLFPMVLVLLFFTIFRIIFHLFNADILPQKISFSQILHVYWVGLRYDFFILLLFNGPFLALFFINNLIRQKQFLAYFLTIVATLVNGFLITISLADIAYFRFNSRRATIEVFDILADSAGAFGSFLLEYWFLVLIGIATWFVLFFVTRKSYVSNVQISSNSNRILIVFLIGTAFYISFNAKQFNPKQVSFYVASEHRALATNTPLTLFYSLAKGQETLERKSYFSNEEVEEYFEIHHQFSSAAPFAKKNIFLFVLESFSQEYLMDNHPNKAPTPFIDSLLKQSMVFENTYANGATSAYGLMNILGGIPPFLDDAYFATIYGENDLTGIGTLLKEYGYTSSFFYGAEDDHYGFRKNMALLGIDNYFSKEDFKGKDGYDGNWGIYDEPFFQFAADVIQQQQTPVFATIFNISSHLPYMVPEHLKDKLPEGTLSSHQSLAYVDYALQQFFQTIQDDPKFENALFVFIADHWAKRKDLEYKNDVGRYRIPFFIYDPQVKQHQIVSTITQQLDVLPTVLNYLNYSGPWMSFGASALKNETGYRFTFNEYENIYQIIDSAYVLAYDENLEQSFSFYQYKNDPDLKNNLLKTNSLKPEIVERKIKMENYLKAVIQTYKNHLLDNDVNIRPKQ